MRTTSIHDEYLGIDTALSPEVIDFINASISSTENYVKQSGRPQPGHITLDEYEQAMAA